MRGLGFFANLSFPSVALTAPPSIPSQENPAEPQLRFQ
ncbi:hypothetical protein ACP70R_044406 [Stipagrostis hirtigluma subsp. patula]